MNSFLILILLIIKGTYESFNSYSCNFDEECPTSMACYSSQCISIFYMEICAYSSDCISECCVNKLCRNFTQSICSGIINSCTKNEDCFSKCCLGTLCTDQSNCGNSPSGETCSDNNNCQSKCCSEGICTENITCSHDQIDDNISKNIKYFWGLSATGILLLIIIIILFIIYMHRNYKIEEFSHSKGEYDEKGTNMEQKLNESKVTLKINQTKQTKQAKQATQANQPQNNNFVPNTPGSYPSTINPYSQIIPVFPIQITKTLEYQNIDQTPNVKKISYIPARAIGYKNSGEVRNNPNEKNENFI